MEKINTLKKLLIEQVRELWNGEYQQLYVLPNILITAEDKELKSLLKNHIIETKQQTKRLKNIFNQFYVTSIGEHSEIMDGLISEANDLIERSASQKIKDAVIITSIQYMKHFEIAGYGSAFAYAEELGLRDIADQLYTSLEEEKKMDNLLSGIAMDQINSKAKATLFV